MALIDDLERGDRLAAEHRSAPPLIGQGRERRRHRVAALGLAEIAFDAPQRHDKARLHAEALLHALQQPQILGQVPARVLDTLRIDHLRDEVGKSQRAIGLTLVELDDLGQKLDIPESEIDRPGPDALRECIAPQAGEKTAEIAFRAYCPSAPQRQGQ
jgi:hypothetical protein